MALIVMGMSAGDVSKCVVRWAWPALRVLAEGRVASLYQDLFWSVM